MKKLTSIILILAILSSCFTFVGCSDNSELTMKENYLKQFKIADKNANEVVIDYDAGTYRGARVVMLDAEWHDVEEREEKIFDININYYDKNSLYAYKFGIFFSIPIARLLGILTDDEIREIAEKFNSEVRHFRDTCDKHDFPDPFWIEDYDGEYNEKFSDSQLYIEIDARVSRGKSQLNYSDAVNYLGTELVKRAMALMSPRITSDLYLLSLREPSMENIEALLKYLPSVPGVLSAGYYLNGMGGPVHGITKEYLEEAYMWGHDYIELKKMWDFTKGSKKIFVGVIDSGIASHSAFSGILEEGYDFFHDNTITNDGDIAHGTSIAGILGAIEGDFEGMQGINQNVSIVPLQTLHPNVGYGQVSNPPELCSAAIAYATASYSDYYPIRIINFSLGKFENNDAMDDMKEEITRYQGLFVCAACNSNININSTPDYPAFYGSEDYTGGRLDNILVVGALDRYGNRWYESEDVGSNYGEGTVHIYAPGVDIISTYPENYYNQAAGFPTGYSIVTGTSYAAPYVAGVAALLLSIEPDLTTAQLKECLLEGADDITIMVGDNNDIPQSAKKLNAWGAFKYLVNNYMFNDNPYLTYTLTPNGIVFNDSITNTGEYSTFDENTSFVKFDITAMGDYTFEISSNAEIEASIYDSNLDPVYIYGDDNVLTGNNLSFTRVLEAGVYYLKTNVTNDSTSEANISFNISYSTHTHDYARWIPYSPTRHIEICDCGTQGSTSPHVVKWADTIGNVRFANCIRCGYLVDLDNIIVEGSGFNNIAKVSVNGSYILPNGIIVLVDEDIEAYLNGTLVFYDKDKLPVVQ